MSMIGKSLIHYEISSQIGRGGMGEVYQAKDKKLGRDVAIKILPEEFAKDSDRVARFQREAKLLASLNHPNIAAIYGLEESDGTNFLVMELIDGDTLADRIKKGPIPVEEALKLALQIAEALEAAHEKGVIHRDLKPANIKITPEDKIKILDFGLAKAFAEDQGEEKPQDSPTLSDAATRQGIILGTAAYMSPEQARGKSVDRRADVWAFGVILYEMLTGKSLFEGEDVTSTLARVLEREPDYSTLTPNLHPRIHFLLERCLEKDANNRYRNISETRIEIQKVLSDPSGIFVQPVTAAKPRKKLQLGIPWIAAALILGLIIAGVAVWYLKPTILSEPPFVTRFEQYPVNNQQLIIMDDTILAVSPDGRHFAYITDKGLYLRSLDELNAKLISSAAEYPSDPFFSPDGRWVGYSSGADKNLKKIAISGGTPKVICKDVGSVQASWDLGNTIVYINQGKGIMQVSASGGIPETLIEEKKEAIFSPRLLPDGKSVLFTIATSEGYKIAVQSLESGERRPLFKGDTAFYLPTGYIVYALESTIYAVPFDLDTLQIAGEKVLMVEGVSRMGPVYAPQYAVSISGTMVYIPAPVIPDSIQGTLKSTLEWVDRNGKVTTIDAPPDYYRNPRISPPDGSRVALTVDTYDADYTKFKSDILIYDFDKKNRTRLTFNEGSAYPLWTLDGKRIAFSLTPSGMMLGDVYWKAADNMGKEEKLCALPNRSLYPCSWADDGKTLVLMDWAANHEEAPGLGSGIGVISIEGDREWKPLLQEKYFEAYPQISPNGQWMAYSSGDSLAVAEVCVCPYPQVNSGKVQVSEEGGRDPLWSPDGRALFYRHYNSIMAVDVQTEPTFKKLGEPKVLFQRADLSSDAWWRHSWDIHPDGKRFLMMKLSENMSSEEKRPKPKIIVVLNWFEELKQRVPID